MASNFQIEWNGKHLEEAVRREITSRLQAVGAAIVARVKANIGGPPGGTGGFPGVVSGELQRSVVARIDPSEPAVYVAATAKHAAQVEKRKPFLVRTMREMEPEIVRIFGSGGGKNLA